MPAKERSSFTLSPNVKKQLEATVPKNCRSQFIELAIINALKDQSKRDFFEMIEAIEPVESDIDSVGLVSVVRESRLAKLSTEINEQ